MGHDNDGVATSGNSTYGDSDDINQGDWFMHSNYLKTDGFTGCVWTHNNLTTLYLSSVVVS